MGIITKAKGNKIKSLAIFLVTLIIILLVYLYSNKIAPVAMNIYGNVNTENGIALQGMDTVAYHTEGKMVQGNPKIQVEVNDAVWQFSSEDNKKLFVSAPEKYMPQYGGYCAYAVSQGATASSAPDIWTIKNGNLYVFHTAEVKATFMDEADNGLLNNANANWETRASN